MDLNSATILVKEWLDECNTSPVSAHRFNRELEVASACNVLVAHFMSLADGEVQKVLYGEYKHVAFALNSFYNETVDFIAHGTERKTSLSTWQSIISSYARDITQADDTRYSQSLGSMILNATYGLRGVVRNYGTSIQSKTVNRDLLSYADHEVFELWISRTNGISDMARSLAVMLKFTHP